jgi:hypothetical protein
MSFLTSFVKAQLISDTVYREDQVVQLLDNLENDPILQHEWLTSLYFHKLVNDYRNEKGLKSIHWNNNLWMAARNQNIYLLRSLYTLSHWQSEEKPFFTGSQPENRVSFVTYESGEFQGAGFENCYFFGKELVLDRMDVTKVNELTADQRDSEAKKVATRAFEWWKKSTGHNKNMLNADHLAHGTSFVFGQQGMYATSIFARKQNYFRPDSVFLPFFEEQYDFEDFKIIQDFHSFAPFSDWNGVVEKKYTTAVRLFFDQHEAPQSDNLETLLNTISLPVSQKEVNQLYRKQNGFPAFFELVTHELELYEFEFKLSNSAFEELTAMNSIRQALEDLMKTKPINIEGWATNIHAEPNEKKVRLKVALLLLAKK